jgi:hypothetical protein
VPRLLELRVLNEVEIGLIFAPGGEQALTSRRRFAWRVRDANFVRELSACRCSRSTRSDEEPRMTEDLERAFEEVCAERDRLRAAIEKHYEAKVGVGVWTWYDEELYRAAGLDVPEMP